MGFKMEWKRQQSEHVCKFNRTNKTLDSLFPENIRMGKIRRKFRESLLVSEEIGRRRCTPKGTAGYLFEKEKHLTQHYYMIHPYSDFRRCWEMAVIVEFILGLTIRGFLISQMEQVVFSCWCYQVAGLVCDLFELTDATVLRFLTGYLDEETRNVALETAKVFSWNMKNACTHLYMATSFPYDFIVFLFVPNHNAYPVLKYSIFLKFLKLPNIYRYVIHMSKVYNWSEITFRGVWIAIAMFVLCNWLTCLFYSVIFESEFGGSTDLFEPDHSALYRHFCVFYLIATIFFFQNGIPSGLSFTSNKNIIFYILLLITINLSNVAFIGTLIQLVGLKNSSFIQYEEMIQEVHKFLIQENLPKHVHKKVIKYFEFRFRHRYFREKVILDTLSPPLRQEIANFLCMHFLASPLSIFARLPSPVASALCLKMKFEVFLAGDVIVRAGKEAQKTYFIHCGTVAVFSQRGQEVDHLYEGSQFGISAFSQTDNHYRFTAIAVETSECYVLRHRDFIACTNDYPECRNLVMQAAKRQRFPNSKNSPNSW